MMEKRPLSFDQNTLCRQDVPDAYIVDDIEVDDNIDGFHNVTVERDEYIEPENYFVKKFREVSEAVTKKFESNHPEGYNHDPDLHDGVVMYYLEFTSYSRSLVNNENFNYFIVLVIILAGINVGIQSYPQMENNTVLDILDTAILIVFSIEVVVKVLAEGLAPWLYFFGEEWKWNNFDFTIVFLSLPFWGGLFGGGSLALLRLVRLMRLAKLIRKIPALEMIVRGLTGGLSSIAYILLLLILVFYLFAVTGYYLFSQNDPFHFKTLPIAMVTMFRCATLDAWSDVMYLNIFGCDSYPYLYVVDDSDKNDGNTLFWCDNPNKQFTISAIYFVSFIVLSALVMLSLFIGAVTLSMNDSLVELKTLAEERKKKERYEKNIAKMFLANARLEKRKEKGSESGSSSNLRKKFISSIQRLRTPPDEFERYKTELQLPPAIVKLHRMQSKSAPEGFPMTRSAILGQTKYSRGKNPRNSPSPPPAIYPPPTEKENASVEMSSCDNRSKSPDESSIPGNVDGGPSLDSCQHNCYSDSEESSLAPVQNQDEQLTKEQEEQRAALEYSAMEKRKKVLSMIAEKQQGEEIRPRRFSFIIPDAIKDRLDRSISMRNQAQVQEVGRLLRIAMGEEYHGEEEGPKSLQSFCSRMTRAKGFWPRFFIFAEYCKFISEHSYFVGMVTFVIILAGINVGAQTEPRLTDIYTLNEVLRVLDILVLTVFTMEVVLKILAEGTAPYKYFRDGWNRFDFIIVVGSYVPGAGSLLTILRLLRLLRVLKLVKSLPQLAVIVNALMMGLTSIGYIGLILFLCFYVFAIAGMMLFEHNDPFHFGNLHIAMFTLFRCSTLDDWSEVLYVNMYGCDEYPGVYEDFPEMCDDPKRRGVLACVYFISFIVIGAQVLLTLFIGVVTTSMEQAKEIQLKEENVERQLSSLEKSLCLSEIQMKCFKKAFYLLDLDGGGTIEEDEVAIGLQSINNFLVGTTIEEEVKKSDPLGNGIDILQFIVVVANIPRCKHRRLIRRTLKRWRDNKLREGSYYIAFKRKPPKISKIPKAPAYLEKRPIADSHFTHFRLQKENLYSLLFSYYQHHKLAYLYFQKNKYTTQMDHLAFMDTKLKRRHSFTNVPETLFEQFLAFGKVSDISDTQTVTNYSKPNKKIMMLREAKRRRQTNSSALSNLSASSKSFFSKIVRAYSHASVDSSGDDNQASPNSSNSALMTSQRQNKSKRSLRFGAVISPRDDNE